MTDLPEDDVTPTPEHAGPGPHAIGWTIPMPDTVWLYTGPNPRLVKVLAWHRDGATVVDYDLNSRLRLTDARPRWVYRSDLAVPHIDDFTGERGVSRLPLEQT